MEYASEGESPSEDVDDVEPSGRPHHPVFTLQTFNEDGTIKDDDENDENASNDEDASRIPSHVRDPFVDRPPPVKESMTRLSKRTQRYRSTASSRIDGMTVGDIRYCFQQLRNAGDELSSEMILYNGKTAGAFALAYLTETSNAMRKRRKMKKSKEDRPVAVADTRKPSPPPRDERPNVLTF